MVITKTFIDSDFLLLVASLRLERKSKVYETLILPLDQLAIKEFCHITWITLNQAHQSHIIKCDRFADMPTKRYKT